MWMKTSLIATLPTTNPTGTGLVLNQGLRGESPVTTAMEQSCPIVRLYMFPILF